MKSALSHKKRPFIIRFLQSGKLSFLYPVLGFKRLIYKNVTLYSTTEINVIIPHILEEVEQRLRKSTLYKPGTSFTIVAIDESSRWKWINEKLTGQFTSFQNPTLILPDFRIKKFQCVNEIFQTGQLIELLSHHITLHLLSEYAYQHKLKSIPHWIKMGYAEYISRDLYDYDGDWLGLDMNALPIVTRYWLGVLLLVKRYELSLDDIIHLNYHFDELWPAIFDEVAEMVSDPKTYSY